MAVTELARMLFVVNTILEKVSSAADLSKRAVLALAILHLEDKPGATMTNHDLHDKFLKYNVSTGLSAKKDASAAKSELLRKKHIEIGDKVSVFGLTAPGRDTISKMHDAMSSALEDLGLSSKERSVLREVIGLPDPTPPRPPTSEKSGRTTRKLS